MLAVLFAASPPAAAQERPAGLRIGVGGIPRGKAMVRSSLLARRLAKEVRKVKRRFDEKREALVATQSPGGEPVYSREQVMSLLDDTERDLDQAIERVREPGLAALRDWAAEELRRIRIELQASGPDTVAARIGPRPVALVASLAPASFRRADLEQGDPERGKESGLNRRPEVEASLLDRVASVLRDIFVLARDEDLQIDVAITSLPVEGAALLLYPPSRRTSQDKQPKGLKTNGTLRSVWRGLYLYELERAPYPTLACPPREGGEWAACKLDLMRSDGPIRCHLEAPPGNVADCSIPEKLP